MLVIESDWFFMLFVLYESSATGYAVYFLKTNEDLKHKKFRPNAFELILVVPPLPVEHSVVAQGCGLSTIHSHTPSVRPTVSTPSVRQLDASSDIRRLSELKRNVVDQDDHQVNLPSKKTCVCLSNSFPCIHQQSVNPVNVNMPSTPVDDHDDHGHNGLHVGAERIPFSEMGSHRPVTSLDSRLAPTIVTFLENIRAYNQMFSMTSLAAQVDDSVNNGRGPYVFKISSQLYHWIGSLCPIEGEPPRTTREKYQDTHVPNFKVRLYNVVGAREYELPTGDMLGAIVYETGPESDMDYDILLEELSGYPQRVNKLHSSYTALQFPLLFIYGQDEQNRIDYVREHQNDIRSEYLYGIYDAINRGDNDGSDCGIRVILPQSFTVEFQKRGLPHCHCLLWIHESVLVSREEDIDMYVSAKLPSEDVDPECYSIVSEFMMHGPCGLACPSASCMHNSPRCKKNFPKEYCQHTYIDKNGFVHYKRRNTDVTTTRQNIKLDNNYVVPYNKKLLTTFYARINVEYYGWSMLIKYLFKYISKGTDCVVARISTNGTNVSELRASTTTYRPQVVVDEIKNYLDARYISPHEACWRIFEFNIHYREPAVQILSVHLMNMQRVAFRDQDRLDSIVVDTHKKKTTLTEWLHYNEWNTDGRHLTYLDFPYEFVWYADGKMLLCHQKGCKSFLGIRTVNDVVYPICRAACEALGLLENDREWEITLEEVALTATPVELRTLLTHILTFCQVSDPMKLWNRTWKRMSEDIPYTSSISLNISNLHIDDSDLEDYVLYELENCLNHCSKSLADFGLRMPPERLISVLKNKLLMEEKNHDRTLLVAHKDQLLPQLNDKQRHIFSLIMDACFNNRQELVFVYGHGGTGKAFL
nr:DNA helicase [Tanacetum cinerariifolium]